MKTVLKIEEALMFGLAIYLNTYLSYAGWLYWAFFLAPDLGFLGYLGAITYNLLHHKGLATALYLIGAIFPFSLCNSQGCCYSDTAHSTGC